MLRRRVKWLAILLVTALAAAAFAGCGGGKSGGPEKGGAADGEQDNRPINTTIVGGRVGGVWSVFTEGVAETIRRTYPGSVVTVEPGSTTGNPGVVSEGRIPYGMAYAMTAYAALKGNEPFEKAYPNLVAVSAIIPVNAYQFVVRKETGLNSIEDIKNKKYPLRISVDEKGSMADIITRAVFEAYGFGYKDIEAWGGKIFYLGGSKTFEMMSDGRMDAMPDALPIPSGDILEASATLNLKMLPLSEEAIAKVGEKLGMTKTTVPAGSYNFLDQDIPTANTQVVLITTEDRPEDEVYKVAKAIYSNLDYLYTVHKGFKDLNKDNIAIVGSLPLHPGAEKFFREIGALK